MRRRAEDDVDKGRAAEAAAHMDIDERRLDGLTSRIAIDNVEHEQLQYRIRPTTPMALSMLC